MAKNCVQSPHRVVPLIAPATLSSGAPAKIGSIIGVALADIASGAIGSFALDGIWTLPKNAVATPITQGQRLMFNNSSGKLETKVTSTFTHAGVAAAAAGTTATEVTLILNHPPVATFTGG